MKFGTLRPILSALLEKNWFTFSVTILVVLMPEVIMKSQRTEPYKRKRIGSCCKGIIRQYRVKP